ncbi:MAG: hypothetical protein WAV15_01660 [Minisyncoccia bacterium]
MGTLSQSEIFFLISSISFVVLWILVGILLYYLIRVTKTFSRIIDNIEKDVNRVGDITKEMFEEMKDSVAWNFLFRKKKARRRN